MPVVAAGAGSVYIFNVCSSTLNVSLNGLPVLALPGWERRGPSMYQPGGGTVPRSASASEGSRNFLNGNNWLGLTWEDGQSFVQVGIDGTALPLNMDILLFVQRNKWRLVDQYGNERASGDITRADSFSGELASPPAQPCP
ncbi:hypothetical protein BWI17_00600 [Betaproteobacteria bacterium GR16-43]|nr:hypothetical protein BWI17_00600 [Betaproteobacteria bacterium GR16-43]